MKRLFPIVVTSALLLSAKAAASMKHKSKDKEKSFEPVASADVGGYTGHYVGIASRYWIDVEMGPDRRLAVALYVDGARVSLRDIQLTASRLEATKVLGDGAEVPFEAAFGERQVNGRRAFGLLVEGDVRIDDEVVLARLFYRRQ